MPSEEVAHIRRRTIRSLEPLRAFRAGETVGERRSQAVLIMSLADLQHKSS